jgi:AIPR protein
MSGSDPVLATYNDIRQQVQLRASVSDDGTLREEVFTRWAIDLLEENGEIGGGECCGYGAPRIGKVSGYWLDPDMGRLFVFVSRYSGLISPPRATATEISGLVSGVLRFIAKCRMGWHRGLEESSEGFEFGEMIASLDFTRLSTRIVVLTDHSCPKVPDLKPKIDGEDVALAVWDLERFHRLLTSGAEREQITIDFSKLGGCGDEIPFLKMPFANEVYDTYLAMVTGDMLARIYRDHGARLLEKNVRTFLQARGKINKGIRETIVKKPEMFLAYNNGLCATAGSVAIKKITGPLAMISSITDFQIVNGGQTTASLTSALQKDHADLSQVLVQLKLSVIKNQEMVGTIVGNISRYANSQNKVSEADLLANDAMHIKVEQLSRTVWAPSKPGANRETKWFYERARGQYTEEKARRRTPAQLRMFEAEYPAAQWFTKTDLAKYENTWDELPHLVSKGAQKNFAEFTLRLNARKGFVPDVAYYQQLVAKAIIFKVVDRIVSGLKFGGHKANVVTYAAAWLAHTLKDGVDLRKIWADQGIDEQLSGLITAVCPGVYGLIIASEGRNVGEWCKSESCWSRIRSNDLGLSAYWKRVIRERSEAKLTTSEDLRAIDGGHAIERVTLLGAETWTALSRWARETNHLDESQRTLAMSIGRTIGNGKGITAKRAIEAETVLQEAIRKGFKCRTLVVA